jgi:hypothetical protein
MLVRKPGVRVRVRLCHMLSKGMFLCQRCGFQALGACHP